MEFRYLTVALAWIGFAFALSRADDTAATKPVITLTGHADRVRCLAFSSDGKLLASGGFDNTVRIWDLARGRSIMTLEGHSKEVNCVVFSPSGKAVASGSGDKTVRLWDVASGKNTATFKQEDIVACLAFTPDGKVLACGGHELDLWDLASGLKVDAVKIHAKYGFSSLAFSADGKMLAYGQYTGKVGVCDLATAKIVPLPAEETEYASPVVIFSPNGKTLTCAGQCIVTINSWDLSTGKVTSTMNIGGSPYGFESTAYLPDGKTLISVDHLGEIRLWDLSAGKVAATVNKGGEHQCSCAAFSPDGALLATATNENAIDVSGPTTRPDRPPAAPGRPASGSRP